MSEITTVRKYRNGKFYCAKFRRYITKKEVFELYKSEGDLKIVCTETGDDITNIEVPKVSQGMTVNVNDIKELFI